MPPPNVLCVIADDQRADSLDWPFLERPFLDRLGRGGTVFTNHFVGVPICTPGRAECLTGCHVSRHGVPWFNCPIRADRTLLPQAFQAAGYHTFHVGKWHNDGHPSDRGFTAVGLNQFEAEDYWARYRQHGHWLRFRRPGGDLIEGHSTELFVGSALEQLAAAPGGRPWFAWLALHSPHDPFGCPEPFASRYADGAAGLPPAWQPMPAVDNGDLTIRDELLLPHPRTPAASARNFARYAAMITHHDHFLARLEERLRVTGEWENTIVCFTSDHGLAVGSNGFLGKENLYDHSCRVPLVLAGPGVPPGQRIPALTSVADLFPTLCGLAGVPVPPSVADGCSLVPLLTRPEAPHRECVLLAFQSPQGEPGDERLTATQRGVRTPTAKLNWYPQTGQFQLFDLQADPLEQDDLLAPWRRRPSARWGYRPPRPEAELRELARTLHARLVALLQAAADPLADRLVGAAPLPCGPA